MDLLANLAIGFDAALTPVNLLYCLIGVLAGTLVGVLPGLGPTATIAMLMPVSFALPPVTAMIMLAGIYYGAQYGGSTTAILVNLPGEATSIVTAIDGYKMAQKGRAGPALAAAAIGSFVAGCIATLIIALFAPPLASVALSFESPEYFSLMILGLIASVVLARGSVLKAVGMIVIGLVLGLIGTDPSSGARRYEFGIGELSDGLGFVQVAMGIFGVSEILLNIERELKNPRVLVKIASLMPTRDDFRRMAAPILRGTFLGSLLGVLPGGGPLLASFGSYSLEKKLSKHPHEFGEGAIEGVAGPESANNAGAQTAFIPMLTLGIPATPTMALMIGALILQGIQPGPSVVTEQPVLFWGIIVSMWIGNLMLVVLNLPLVGIWVRLCMVPYHLLYPAILVFCAIGAFSLSNSTFDVQLIVLFGLVGYVLAKLDCDPAPMMLALILGPMIEQNLRRSLTIARGDVFVFVERPISAVILLLAAVGLALAVLPMIRKKRDQAFQE